MSTFSDNDGVHVCAGMIVDSILFALLWLLWRLSKWANRLSRWLALRRRLRDYIPKVLSPSSSVAEKEAQVGT